MELIVNPQLINSIKALQNADLMVKFIKEKDKTRAKAYGRREPKQSTTAS